MHRSLTYLPLFLPCCFPTSVLRKLEVMLPVRSPADSVPLPQGVDSPDAAPLLLPMLLHCRTLLGPRGPPCCCSMAGQLATRNLFSCAVTDAAQGLTLPSVWARLLSEVPEGLIARMGELQVGEESP